MTIDLGPIDHSVLTEQVKHRSELLWNPGGQDPPSTLDCRTHHEELRLRVPMVDYRVLAILRWAGAMCRKNTPIHVLSTYRNQISTTRPDQVKWEPHGNDLSHLPPSFRTEGSNMWRSTIPLICFWLVEFHLSNRVLRQFGLKHEQPRDANTNRDLHKINARDKVDKNYKESYEYKFIKKALEDVDEVDRHNRPPMPPIPRIDTGSPSRFTHAKFKFSPPTTTVNHNSPMAPSYSSPQTVIPTLSLQTPHIELMSTSPSHTQSSPTSSILIHVPQVMHPHDSDVEQGQRDQAKQPQDANTYAAPTFLLV
nr:serine/threonine-protein phosphatase 7 long form like [Quercus suber]